MFTKLLEQLRGWLSSIFISWYTPFWEAKKYHEKSPHGLFTRGIGLYNSLTPSDVEAAANCPRLARAIKLYIECIERERNSGRILNEGIARQQLGLVLHRQGKIEAAKEEFERALKILLDIPHNEALFATSTCHFRIAEIFLVIGNKDLTKFHLEKSRSIDKKLNDKFGLNMCEELGRLLESKSTIDS